MSGNMTLMTKVTPPLPAVGYVRVSTDKQEVSREAQQERIRAQATLKGVKLLDILVDDAKFSGDLNRDGLKKVLALVRERKISAVIVTKLDRLTRSTRDMIHLMEMFDKKKVALVSIAETLDTKSPTGRFFVRMLANIGELERETIGDRTRTGMGQLKSMGFPVGNAPYGHRRPGRSNHRIPLADKLPLLVNESEQKVLDMVRQLREENVSLRKIAGEFNAAGLRTRKGTEWRFQYVARMVRQMEEVQA
jgi:site-specific DNA recombinase